MTNRLATPLPQSVLDRFYSEHPEERPTDEDLGQHTASIDEPYLHASNVLFEPGEQVHPANVIGARSPYDGPNPHYSGDHVYLYRASEVPENFRFQGGTVYEVEPHGDVEPDPEPYRGKPLPGGYRTKGPVTVKRLVSNHWRDPSEGIPKGLRGPSWAPSEQSKARTASVYSVHDHPIAERPSKSSDGFTEMVYLHPGAPADEENDLQEGEAGLLAYKDHGTHIEAGNRRTHSQHRRQGIGTALQDELERRAAGRPIISDSETFSPDAWHLREHYVSTHPSSTWKMAKTAGRPRSFYVTQGGGKYHECNPITGQAICNATVLVDKQQMPIVLQPEDMGEGKRIHPIICKRCLPR